jgi:hypothetical protein
MASMEQPQRLRHDYTVSEDDIRQLMGSSTPHFALQIRDRIQKLIRPLPPGDPARQLGELEVARLERLAYSGENRGIGAQDGQRPLASNADDDGTTAFGGAARGPVGDVDPSPSR